ncbi:hypothetical protein [Candidatus Amarolinea aalborgensis]|uniref:hypothetical protein n=1 Tax=Candidatus Amarolinea aalborgensis TaxID=2249329 RepID=UPI003BF95C2D
MSNATNESAQTADDDMRSAYDFSDGVRGKHVAAMCSGYTITIQRADGTTETREVKPTEGAVFLEPDVLRYFPDSESVNRALRTLIALFPKEPVRGNRRTAHRSS